MSYRYVRDVVQKFEETGSVCDKAIKQLRVLTDAAQIEILGQFAVEPTTSISEVDKIVNISVGCIHKVLKLNKFFPYIMSILQQLGEDDYNRRIEFCERMMKIHTCFERFIRNIHKK